MREQIIEGTKLVRLMAADNGKRKCMESVMIRGRLVCLEQGGEVMSELVKRLRGPTWVMSCYSKSEHLYAAMREAMREAADALEAQAKRITELEARLVDQTRFHNDLVIRKSDQITELSVQLADSNEALQVMGLKLAHAEADAVNLIKKQNEQIAALKKKLRDEYDDYAADGLKDKSHSANTVGGPTPVMDAAPACERKE